MFRSVAGTPTASQGLQWVRRLSDEATAHAWQNTVFRASPPPTTAAGTVPSRSQRRPYLAPWLRLYWTLTSKTTLGACWAVLLLPVRLAS